MNSTFEDPGLNVVLDNIKTKKAEVDFAGAFLAVTRLPKEKKQKIFEEARRKRLLKDNFEWQRSGK